MQSHYIYQDTNRSLKIGFKNIRRSSPTRDQNWPLETQVEETNQDANLAESFAVLTTTLNKLNLTNMPSSTKDYIVRKATSLQNRANDIRQQQLQQQAITETIFLENSRTKRGDVLDLQELESVLEHMEMLQTMRSDSLREQQFQSILELGVELQDILKEIKKLHNAYPLPEGDLATPVKSVANTPDCILDTPRKYDGPALKNTRIPQNPRKIRKKKKKQISLPCPPQTLEPEKTDQPQHLPTNFIQDATASEKTHQTQHFPISETLKPRKDISYLIITAKCHHCHLQQHIPPPDSL
jgi:hypothetical protein